MLITVLMSNVITILMAITGLQLLIYREYTVIMTGGAPAGTKSVNRALIYITVFTGQGIMVIPKTDAGNAMVTTRDMQAHTTEIADMGITIISTTVGMVVIANNHKLTGETTATTTTLVPGCRVIITSQGLTDQKATIIAILITGAVITASHHNQIMSMGITDNRLKAGMISTLIIGDKAVTLNRLHKIMGMEITDNRLKADVISILITAPTALQPNRPSQSGDRITETGEVTDRVTRAVRAAASQTVAWPGFNYNC